MQFTPAGDRSPGTLPDLVFAKHIRSFFYLESHLYDIRRRNLHIVHVPSTGKACCNVRNIRQLHDAENVISMDQLASPNPRQRL